MKTNNITFYQAIKNFWIGYVDFKGRTSRKEYWLTSLFLFILLLATAVLSLNLAACVSIICMLPVVAMFCRRFRDTGISIWWLIAAIAFIGITVVLPHVLKMKIFINCMAYGKLCETFFALAVLTKVHISAILGSLPGLIIALLPSRKH